MNDVFGMQQFFAVARRHGDKRGCWVKPTLANLALNREMVRWKGMFFDQDLVPIRCGPVEADEQQVQIDAERVHHRDFIRLSTDNPSHRVLDRTVIIGPTGVTGEMTLDAECRPPIELADHVVASLLGHGAERVADEVNRVGSSFGRRWKFETVAHLRKRIRSIEFGGLGGIGRPLRHEPRLRDRRPAAPVRTCMSMTDPIRPNQMGRTLALT